MVALLRLARRGDSGSAGCIAGRRGGDAPRMLSSEEQGGSGESGAHAASPQFQDPDLRARIPSSPRSLLPPTLTGA